MFTTSDHGARAETILTEISSRFVLPVMPSVKFLTFNGCASKPDNLLSLLLGVEAEPRYNGSPYQMWLTEWAREAIRILKPGGHLAAFGGTRTYHRLTCALEDAGFEIRDCLLWLHAQGFPKSHNVSKAIDKAARGVPQGAEDPTSPNHGKYRTQATEGKRGEGDRGQGFGAGPGQFMLEDGERDQRSLVAEAEAAEGLGTALKPGWEPIVLARKPLEGTVAQNVQRWGTGALNIEACRVQGAKANGNWKGKSPSQGLFNDSPDFLEYEGEEDPLGRWPANVLFAHDDACDLRGTKRVETAMGIRGVGQRRALSDSLGADTGQEIGYGDADGMEEVEDWNCAPGCPVALLNMQAGVREAGGQPARRRSDKFRTAFGDFSGEQETGPGQGRSVGAASRFFFVSKARPAEREAGLLGKVRCAEPKCGGLDTTQHDGPRGPVRCWRNPHPTVKPLDLMRYLVRLVAPRNQLVLDPFAGSGTTVIAAVLEGLPVIGIDNDAEYDYVTIARHRVAWWERAGPEADPPPVPRVRPVPRVSLLDFGGG